MNVSFVLFGLSGLCGLISLVFLFIILLSLQNKGVNINFINVRWNLFVYLEKYRKVTLDTTGRVGLAYYLYYLFAWFTILLFLGSVINKIMSR